MFGAHGVLVLRSHSSGSWEVLSPDSPAGVLVSLDEALALAGYWWSHEHEVRFRMRLDELLGLGAA